MKLSSISREWTRYSSAVSPTIAVNDTGRVLQGNSFPPLRAPVCHQRLKLLQRWLDSIGSSHTVPLLFLGETRGEEEEYALRKSRARHGMVK